MASSPPPGSTTPAAPTCRRTRPSPCSGSSAPRSPGCGAPSSTYNVLLRLALAASALSMCLVLRRWARWWPACFFGGLIYGFSPYMVGQGEGHLFLTFTVLPPLIVLVVDEILVRRRWSARRGGIVLGLLVVGQYLISPEVLVMTACHRGIGVVVVAVTRVAEVACRPGSRGGPCGRLGPGCVPRPPGLPGVGAAGRARARHRTPAPAGRTGRHYPGDLVAAVVPTALLRTAPVSLFVIGHRLSGANPAENGLYLGVPLLLALIGFTDRLPPAPAPGPGGGGGRRPAGSSPWAPG